MRYRGKSRTLDAATSERQQTKALAMFVTEVDALMEATPLTEMTFADLLDRWLETKAHLEFQSLVSYRSHVAGLKRALGSTQVAELTEDDFNDFYRELVNRGRKSNTINAYHRVASGALKYGVRRGWVGSNVSFESTRPSPRTGALEVPTPDEVRLLMAAASSPEEALAFHYLAVGWMRRAEMCGNRWTDLDLKTGDLTIGRSIVDKGNKGGLVVKDTKGHRPRKIKLDGPTLDRLRKHRWNMEQRGTDAGRALDANAYIFSDNLDGLRPWRPSDVTRAFQRAAAAVGLTMHLHCLRHFGVTEALARGLSITMASHRLGHAKVMTTVNIYAHYMPATDDLAADLMGTIFD